MPQGFSSPHRDERFAARTETSAGGSRRALSGALVLLLWAVPAAAIAEDGHAPPSRTQLAQTFLDGRTLKEAPAFIVQRYRRRAEAGDVRAQFYLGLMHEQGLIGDAPDEEAARRWFAAAAEAGYPPAQYKLGVFFEEGTGGPEDPARAATLYRAASEAGLAEAQYNYALMLSQGRGGARDTRAAIRWFEQAGLAGVTEAQMALAEIYSAGSGGVPADSVEAWAWLSRAADAGNVEAADLLTTLERRMDEAERAEATKLKQAHDALARMRRGG